ncbi:MAG TPA: hypothetical protein VE223_03440 [Nitrososphaeraceae archaeon]|nr:hypothetical protein [Nitrososphaeraceae archaeon]
MLLKSMAFFIRVFVYDLDIITVAENETSLLPLPLLIGYDNNIHH